MAVLWQLKTFAVYKHIKGAFASDFVNFFSRLPLGGFSFILCVPFSNIRRLCKILRGTASLLVLDSTTSLPNPKEDAVLIFTRPQVVTFYPASSNFIWSLRIHTCENKIALIQGSTIEC
ncbi:hypothetical protein PHYBLDRAFT_70491 [Phycomyces blakesleeanus NRRL 1555(-)]|uniref:Uncharacterized protein n=1 Tax=Phycomyces blakesleeanus (strain ATCC 8743b / DSM 1359 / FGSC 10004 / NBRC 33097 / NRRL 1555) TaxID=763407 RepID=A0A162NI18_PHYB8|nr:hypothetical protein PHYBLDRAFT_70491 [Phycomyces blakesleeanus NRRL 1555(-)]OAD69854.1 hypothetical protein PHYBLDRAFT_70491 [Phycomyces blakesleeanus NRRL 1555(-)]|eukprot:XP_018287894.1 hypothetical protein PHYBLDRAFT_70491 [Phycomyces blakesleeanus NRRL 1555(-)]